MSGLIVIPKPANAAAQVIQQRNDMLRSMVPTAAIDPDLWLASLMVEVNALSKPVTAGSVAVAALNAAYLGLQFGKSLGHAFIIPYGQEATLVIGYKGFRHLAFATGFLKTIHAEVVCRGEEFRQWVDENGPHFLHVPGNERNPSRDDITHAYCVYTTRDGGTGAKIVPRSEINRSDKQRDVWKSDYLAMCLKTSILKASKQWNTTARLAHAVAIDEQTEREEPQALPPGSEADSAPKAVGFTLPTGEKKIEAKADPVIEVESEGVKAWRVTIGFADTPEKQDKLYGEFTESHGGLDDKEVSAVEQLFDEAEKKLALPY